MASQNPHEEATNFDCFDGEETHSNGVPLFDPSKIGKRKTTDDLGSSSDSFVSGLDDKVRHHDRTDTEYESDKAYREITKKIIEVSKEHLQKQRESKASLRKLLSNAFMRLLFLQSVAIIAMLFFQAFECVPFNISETLLKVYITSVFLETLSAVAVMIAFAFASKEESKIVEVLNNIIRSYQKFQIDAPQPSSQTTTHNQ